MIASLVKAAFAGLKNLSFFGGNDSRCRFGQGYDNTRLEHSLFLLA